RHGDFRDDEMHVISRAITCICMYCSSEGKLHRKSTRLILTVQPKLQSGGNAEVEAEAEAFPATTMIRRLLFLLCLFLTRPFQLASLSSDGYLLLSFKRLVLSDPLSALATWNDYDATPCQWNGVNCTDFFLDSSWTPRVTSLLLPNSKLLGSIPATLTAIDTLQKLDLSDNFLNGTLPPSLFNASDLRFLSLSNNELSGELPDDFAGLKSLEFLNLSDNALSGRIPDTLVSLVNLSVLCLSNNYFHGGFPTAFGPRLEVFDLSSNLLNGSLPRGFDASGGSLRLLNLSYNRLSGGIPTEFASAVPMNASLDLSFNKLAGGIPEVGGFAFRKAESFDGNPDLCGKPLKNPCSIPSTLSTPPNSSTSTSPLAIAAIPKNLDTPRDGSAAAGSSNGGQRKVENGLKPGVVVGIIVADLFGIAIISIIVLYFYQSKKAKEQSPEIGDQKAVEKVGNKESPSSNSRTMQCPWLRRKGTTASSNEDETSDSAGSEVEGRTSNQQLHGSGGELVAVDGESKLELETLLKASAYILGSAGPTIVYKAVLEDGTTFAVRRIGEACIEKMRDFENQVRFIAKLRHPNLLRLRGFYWGEDEKLVIYDYAPNGSLANASNKRMGSPPIHLSWEVRLRIARGLARGLTYLHEKKHVHGKIKPSNILLGSDMEPTISDFGLERLIRSEDTSDKAASSSGRQLGSRQSVVSKGTLHDLPIGASTGTSIGSVSPYRAPEAVKNLKPSPRWDVFSFGVVLLELLSGKMLSEKEVRSQWNVGLEGEEKHHFLMMADATLNAELEGKEEPLFSCFKLGFSCASVVPQKRPSMKEALQILDKILS
ncbi:hypothetical protein ACLOJK_000856, partial [Asimina triloba]